jgi:transcriptional regulator with XRE-family HTH domain
MTNDSNKFGEFLRHKRSQINPVALGLPEGRRRTPGLRREEIALRANISAAWYTCLEQGRGGAASAEVLNRLASALMLTEVECEHLFMLGLGHLPEMWYQAEGSVSPRIQRILDAFSYSPAIVKTLTWDVLAWNKVASLVLADYSTLLPKKRNVMRLLFADHNVRNELKDWEKAASNAVATFRADVARAGANKEVDALVRELCDSSKEFSFLWKSKDVQSFEGIIKHIVHPEYGDIALEYSSFAIDSRRDLTMAVFNPVSEHDRQVLQLLLGSSNTIKNVSAV